MINSDVIIPAEPEKHTTAPTPHSFSATIKMLNKKSIKDAMSIILEKIAKNACLAQKFASYLSTRIDFTEEIFKQFLSNPTDHQIILIQWMHSYDMLPRETLLEVLPYQYLLFMTKRELDDRARIARSVQKPFEYRDQQNISDKSDHAENQLMDPWITLKLNKINQLKTNNPVLYSMLMRDTGIENDEGQTLKSFCKLIYLLSPKVYKVLHSIIPTTYARSTVFEAVQPSILSYSRGLMSLDIDSFKNIVIDNIGFDTRSLDQPIICSIGGDAACVYEKQPNNHIQSINLYNFSVLPLHPDLPTFSIHCTTFKMGSAPAKLKEIFEKVITNITQLNFNVVFKCCDGERTLDAWFEDAFQILLEKHTLSELTFEDAINIASSKKPWPISDPLHIFKCARARVQQHLLCVDLANLICINMEMFKDATQLHLNIEDRSTYSRMNDQFALEFISYDSFVQLIYACRFEAAYYIFPFMCMNEAIRNATISRKERFIFLKMAYIVMKEHFNQIESNPYTNMFPQKYQSTSIGTCFGPKIFVKRIICTLIAIALSLNIPGKISLDREGTHCIECLFGMIRDHQKNNNTLESATSAVSIATNIEKLKRELGCSTHINHRENNGGVKLAENDFPTNELFFNDSFFPNALYILMTKGTLPEELFINFIMQINAYSKRYSSKPTTKRKQPAPNMSSGPLSRYLTVYTYKLSTTPIPKAIHKMRCLSPLDFYFSIKKSDHSKQSERYTEFQNFILNFVNNLLQKDATMFGNIFTMDTLKKNQMHLQYLLKPQETVNFLKIEESGDVHAHFEIQAEMPREMQIADNQNFLQAISKKPHKSHGEKLVLSSHGKTLNQQYKEETKKFEEKFKQYLENIWKTRQTFHESLNIQFPIGVIENKFNCIEYDDSEPFAINAMNDFE